jgi:hypothetical protein
VLRGNKASQAHVPGSKLVWLSEAHTASGAIARDASEIAAGALEDLKGPLIEERKKEAANAVCQEERPNWSKRWTMVWYWFVNKTGTN